MFCGLQTLWVKSSLVWKCTKWQTGSGIYVKISDMIFSYSGIPVVYVYDPIFVRNFLSIASDLDNIMLHSQLLLVVPIQCFNLLCVLYYWFCERFQRFDFRDYSQLECLEASSFSIGKTKSINDKKNFFIFTLYFNAMLILICFLMSESIWNWKLWLV